MTSMEAQIAVAKHQKYATSESGDSLETIERPGGGISVVLADGQRSGKSAKAISNVICRKAVSLLAEGVRDGAAARAASDYLFTYRGGQVLSTLNILSIDLSSETLVLTRNNPSPVILISGDQISLLNAPSEAVGARRGIRPAIHECPLAPGLTAIMYTDGLELAGDRTGKRLDIISCLQELLQGGPVNPVQWADHLLSQAYQLDQGRPLDDISVVVGAILPRRGDQARRLSVRMPL